MKVTPIVRFQCMALASKVSQPRETLEARTDLFCAFVQGSKKGAGDGELRYDCLALAVQTHGPLARIYATGIVAQAEVYLRIVKQEPQAPEQAQDEAPPPDEQPATSGAPEGETKPPRRRGRGRRQT
jgi:hypothetical protein